MIVIVIIITIIMIITIIIIIIIIIITIIATTIIIETLIFYYQPSGSSPEITINYKLYESKNDMNLFKTNINLYMRSHVFFAFKNRCDVRGL